MSDPYNYSRFPLSGSTNYKPIKITGTALISATTLHTVAATGLTEVYAWVVNTSAVAVPLTVYYNSGVMVESFSVPANSPPIPILTGQMESVSAWAGTANVLNVVGHCNYLLQGGTLTDLYLRSRLNDGAATYPRLVAATATPGTLIHSSTISTNDGGDELYLWVCNTSAVAVPLTLEWGGVTDPDDLACKSFSVPAYSAPIPVAPGIMIRGNLLVRAFAGTTNVLNITGYANTIS